MEGLINKVFNEDCLEGMKRIADDSIDLTITSPPYDNLRTYNGNSSKFKFERIADELYRITKQGGVVVWIVRDATINGSETGTSFKQALYFKDIGFKLHDTMIYQKKGTIYPDTLRYYNNFEYMFVLVKGKIRTVHLLKDRINKCAGDLITKTDRKPNGKLMLASGTKNHSRVKNFGVRYNVWQYATGYMLSAKNKIAFEHPAIFPYDLAKDHILSWSDEGDLVLDPMIGSGSTAVAAINTNRNFIGFETETKYFDIANKRIEEAIEAKTQRSIA